MKKFITKIEFAKLLAIEILNSAFAGATSKTAPKLNKKNRVTGEPLPFNEVYHFRTLGLQLGYDYEGQTNRNAAKEGLEANFEAQEHAWARRVSGNLAKHKDYELPRLADGSIDWENIDVTKLYMPYKVDSIGNSVYVADGKEIALDILTNYFPPKSAYESQPAEKKVAVQYMKLGSVQEFRFAGIEYQIM